MKRFVVFILVFLLFLAFIVLNLESKSDISLGFYHFYDVPVFLIAFFAFIFGMLVALPLLLPLGKGRDHGEKIEKLEKPPKLKKFKKAKVETLQPIDEITKEKSLYGID